MSQFTLADALSAANPSNIADALRKVDLAQLLTPQSRLITLPVAGQVVTLDPPALSAAGLVAYVPDGAGVDSGYYMATDAGAGLTATATRVGVAVLLDPATLQFPSDVALVSVSYIAASKTALDVPFAFSAP